MIQHMNETPQRSIAAVLLLCALWATACRPNPNEMSTPAPLPLDAGRAVVVAWSQDGDLFAWRAGDERARRIASGGVIQPYIAPDGAHVAFTRGPGGLPQSLWVVDWAGAAEQQIADPASLFGTAAQIGQVSWATTDTLYFNTLRRDGFSYRPQDDLYRANIRLGERSLLLRPTEGGSFALSPDGEYIAVVYSGTYGRQDGRIRVIDRLGRERPRNLLFFVGVATGASYPFYPPIAWTPDSASLFAAIPDKDLVYSETSAQPPPETTLWRLPIADPSERAIIGRVRASFFGLPQWSPDGQALVYLQRDAGTNRFALLRATADGSEAVMVAEGTAGALAFLGWLPTGGRFAYMVGDERRIWVAGPDGVAVPLNEGLWYAPRWLDEGRIVFVARQGDGVALYYWSERGGVGSIAPVGDSVPLYDARLLTENPLN